MMEDLEALIAACAAHPARDLDSRLKAGDDVWFTGSAVRSEATTVALAQRSTVKLIFRVEDIRAVHKQGERYFVSVSADANVMIGHQQIIKAQQATCGCHAEPSATADEGNGSIARTIGDRIDPNADVNFIEDWGCWWRFNCYTVFIPLLGPIRVCIPTGYYCS